MSNDLQRYTSHQWGLVTAAQAYECGYTPTEIRRLRKAGLWWAPRAGIYLPAPPPPESAVQDRHLVAAAAGLLAIGRKDAVVAHVSAAVAWDLQWYRPPDLSTACIAWPAGGRPRYYRGLRILPATLPAHRVGSGARGLPVTTVARTVADLARSLELKGAVVLGDSAARIHGVGSAEVLAALTECDGWPNTRRARRAAEFVDGRAESPAESIARVVLLELGFERPELQVDLSDGRGRIGRVDFLFRSRWTIVEVDGKCKYGSDPDAVWREKKREDRLRRLGYEVVRLTYADLEGPPGAVRAMILEAFGRAARRGR